MYAYLMSTDEQKSPFLLQKIHLTYQILQIFFNKRDQTLEIYHTTRLQLRYYEKPSHCRIARQSEND